MNIMRYLKDLSELHGVSGREDNIRNYIIKNIEGKAEYYVDALGNVIAHKKGAKPAKRKVMIDAHMDEVGFIITGITDEGLLHFSTVGGIDKRIMLGSRVIMIESGLKGVIAGVPVHLLKGDEKSKAVDFKDLTIDIGASSKEDAEKYVKVGDTATFDTKFEQMGDFFKAKALDDRIGCAILLEIVNSDQPYDLDISFSVMEEVGLIGAKIAAYNINPEYAIAIDGTTAADVDGVKGENKVCSVTGGPVVSFMDRATMYSKKLFDYAFNTAKCNNLNIQTKTRVAGGNNSGSIHVSRGGVQTLSVSLPCRYIHAPSSVCSNIDVEHSLKLIELSAAAMASGELDD